MGSETLALEKGVGSLSGKGTFQPSAYLRKELKIRYKPNGEVQIKGQLDLFEPGRSFETYFKGNLKDQKLETIWEEGDLIVVKFQKM